MKADLTLWVAGDETIQLNGVDAGFATLRLGEAHEITVHAKGRGLLPSPERRAADLAAFEALARKILAAVDGERGPVPIEPGVEPPTVVDVVFDGSGPNLQFVEVETPDGVGVCVGEWVDHGPYRALRFHLAASEVASS
jgi:hypothetical protein